MFLYRITLNEVDYDQYDSFLVFSKDKESAISLLKKQYPNDSYRVDWENGYEIELIDLNLLQEETILFRSYNAG